MSPDLCDECRGFALHQPDCSKVEERDGERGRAAWFGDERYGKAGVPSYEVWAAGSGKMMLCAPCENYRRKLAEEVRNR